MSGEDEYPTPEIVRAATEAVVAQLETARTTNAAPLDIDYWMGDDVRLAALVVVLLTATGSLYAMASAGHDDHDDSCHLRPDKIAAWLRARLPDLIDLAHALEEANIMGDPHG
ncbi:MAG: hypothetical protein ACEQSX_08025 [Baekduiaceae bacterium]